MLMLKDFIPDLDVEKEGNPKVIRVWVADNDILRIQYEGATGNDGLDTLIRMPPRFVVTVVQEKQL